MSELPMLWKRFQLDTNNINKTHLMIYANEVGFTREQSRMDLTEDEARYLIGEIENALYVIAQARDMRAKKDVMAQESVEDS